MGERLDRPLPYGVVRLIRRTESRMIARVTSYEMVCATARRAPIRAYFEFEAHPDQRIE